MDSSQLQLGGSNRGGSLGRSSLSGRSSFPAGGKPNSATFVSLAGKFEIHLFVGLFFVGSRPDSVKVFCGIELTKTHQNTPEWYHVEVFYVCRTITSLIS